MLALLFFSLFGNGLDVAFASERIGNLVFSTMRKIRKTHSTYLSEVKKHRAQRKAANADLQTAKKNFEIALNDLDKKENHAKLSYAQAKVFQAIYGEAKLTRQIAKKQLDILYRLNQHLKSNEAGVEEQLTAAVIEASKPLLSNGKSLLISLSRYKDKIKDPAIHSKLNAIVGTAHMLSNYVKHLENNKTNQNTSQLVLKQQMTGLIEQLNSLYIQTDIYMAMVKDRSTVLKMITELASSESVVAVLTEGKKTLNGFSDQVMNGLLAELTESDENMETLFDGIVDNRQGSKQSIAQPWTAPNF